MDITTTTFTGTLLQGKSTFLSLANDATPQLWRQFIQEAKGSLPATINRYNGTVYPAGFDMRTFGDNTVMQRWAAVEARVADQWPQSWDTLEIPPGEYATFTYKGLPSGFGNALAYFYQQWLPSSGYVLDERPHFEVLGPDYRPDDPDAEETVWIPIKKPGL